MTSLPKQWKMLTSAKPNKLYIIRKVLMRAIQKCTFCQILAFFTMPALQIWPCHPDPRSKFRKNFIFPNFSFNIGKSCKISSRKALYFRSYQPKTSCFTKFSLPPCIYTNYQREKVCSRGNLTHLLNASNPTTSVPSKYQPKHQGISPEGKGPGTSQLSS